MHSYTYMLRERKKSVITYWHAYCWQPCDIGTNHSFLMLFERGAPPCLSY